MTRHPIIAIAGLSCENSTFTPSRTDKTSAFHAKRGHEIVDYYTFLHPAAPLGRAADWRGALIGHALPGGIVTQAVFEQLADELIARLEDIVDSAGGAIDGLWFDVHGAMYVQGYLDIESELLRRIRTVIGSHAIVSASMDLHGNVSRGLAHQTDLITCFRTAPHEDVLDTCERACRNLVNVLKLPQGSRPLKFWIPLPILLPGEQTSTRNEPAKHIYAAVPGVEEMDGVIDAAIWVGYAWADEARNRAVIMVTGWEETAMATGAEMLAKLFWDARTDFHFVAPTGTLTECLNTALASKARPFFISDSGDNPTAGGSGDVTWGLVKVLERSEFETPSGPTVIYASIPGRKAIEIAIRAGLGATVTVTTGADVDNTHAGPITMTGRVHAIKQGDKYAETEVVLQVGSIYAILTKLRKPYHKEQDFTDLGLEPRKADIVIVKIGYLEPELYDMAKGWMLALTPGGVDQDLKRLGHHNIRRPMWPFDTAFTIQPDLHARAIPASNLPLDGPDE